MLKDELTGNPRWGQNVIDKINMKIFVPVLAFKRRSEVWYVMFQVNKYVFILFILHFVLTRWKYWDKTLKPCDKKNRRRRSKVFCIREL